MKFVGNKDLLEFDDNFDNKNCEEYYEKVKNPLDFLEDEEDFDKEEAEEKNLELKEEAMEV